jgi:hypothetical protein
VSWLEIVLIIVASSGLFLGAVMVAQSPSFWLGMIAAAVKAAMPKITAIVLKRMPPEKEQEWRDCIRRGGEWDHIRKKCKR